MSFTPFSREGRKYDASVSPMTRSTLSSLPLSLLRGCSWQGGPDSERENGLGKGDTWPVAGGMPRNAETKVHIVLHMLNSNINKTLFVLCQFGHKELVGLYIKDAV